jgi:hypothetical protein
LKDEIRIKHMGFDGRLEKPPIDALRPIIPDNAYILCHTYSSYAIIAKSRTK